MKIGGVEVNGPGEEVLVLPRSNGNVVFKARAVLDMTEFYDHCPPPVAPKIIRAGGEVQENLKSPSYKQANHQHSMLRFAYIAIKSLEPSCIEWETIDMEKPQTWLNWEDELRKAGFSGVEIQRITVLVMQANALDESKLKLAREAFLLGQAAASETLSGQSIEQPSTPSGKDASDLESDHQD